MAHELLIGFAVVINILFRMLLAVIPQLAHQLLLLPLLLRFLNHIDISVQLARHHQRVLLANRALHLLVLDWGARRISSLKGAGAITTPVNAARTVDATRSR